MIISTNDKQAVKKLIKDYSKQGQKYYVYVLIRPDNNQSFYVGKGQNQRVLEHEKEIDSGSVTNPYKVNIIKKILSAGEKLIYGIDSFFSSEEDALDRECKLIAEIGRSGLGAGSLTNLTDGGEGFLGLIDFNNHTRSGRDLDRTTKYSWLPGDINILMEKNEGITEEDLLDYLNKGMYDENYRENIGNKVKELQQIIYGKSFELEFSASEFFKHNEWEGDKAFWGYWANGYGAEAQIFSYLYGDRQDIALKAIELNEKVRNTYFRREDEMEAFIQILFSSENWIDIDDLKNQIRDYMRDYKQPSELDLNRVINHFVDKLVIAKKILKKQNIVKWNTRTEKGTIVCRGLKASELVNQVDGLCRKIKNAYIQFYSSDDQVVDHLIIFPHHFRKGLKTFSKQTIVLKMNTNDISYLKIYAL